MRRHAWFNKWIIGKRTLQELSQVSGRSVRTLQRLFGVWLSRPPQPRPVSNQKSILVIDGTWFNREHCLIVYYDAVKRHIQCWRYSSGEHGAEILSDLEALKAGGVICCGATSDGGKGIIFALNRLYPDIPKQRCLVHLQRLSLAWLTRWPKTDAGRELRSLCLLINQIETRGHRDIWLRLFHKWLVRHHDFLKERTLGPDRKRWWYTHKNLRKVRRYLLNALPFMFLYLDHRSLPKDTNALEGGIFSPLKEICRSHRGVTKQKRANFLAWYLYLKYKNRQ